MKQKLLLILLTLWLPLLTWASPMTIDYEDGDTFTAFVPLNENDSVEMTFRVIDAEKKKLSVGNFFSFHYSPCVDTSVKGKIEVPSTINGYTVVSIDQHAFSNDGITSIILPSTISEIGYCAFTYCQNLESIFVLSSTLPILGDPIDGGNGADEFVELANPLYNPFSENNKIFVPASLFESYKKSNEWRFLSNQIYAIEGETDYDVHVIAQDNCSNICSTIGEDNLAHIVSLKLTGFINGYDVKVIREKMPLLKHLDLSDVDIASNDYIYYTDENDNDYHTINDMLGDYFFCEMQNLHDIKLPKHIKGFGEFIFKGCNNLKVVTTNLQKPLSITETTFSNRTEISLLVPSKEEYLVADYWKDFKDITDDSDIIHFADKTVENICVSNWDTNGDGKLSKNEASKVTNISSYFAFTDITSFNELQYFTGIKTIRGRCFENCSNLTSIYIPENVRSINGIYCFLYGEDNFYFPFRGCNKLKEVHVTNLESWMNTRFYIKSAWTDDDGEMDGEMDGEVTGDIYCNPLYYAGHLYIKNQEVTNLIIPESITEINPYIFAGCLGFTMVDMNNSITSIGDYAFYGCNWVKSISFPNSITNIGAYAFSGCISLNSVTIPNNVKSIAEGVFRDCI